MNLIRNRLSFVGIGILAAVVVGGAAVAADAPAVEWKVSDGGNGHWYELIINGPMTWTAAKGACEQRGGHLVTPTTPTENAFVTQLGNRADHPDAWVNDFGGNAGGPWLGGYQPIDAPIEQPWAWVTGEPWTWSGWAPGEPNGGYGPGVSITVMLGYANSNYYRGWADAGLTDFPPYPLAPSYIVEWSADCNGDGVVDYGQIQSGELADTNNNGVPDVCELMITSVQPISGASTGGTAVRINGNNFPTSPVVTIGGVAATDIVRVTPSLITAVTPAGTPGMTVVAVNSASSESFYYRPSCDGDLDNNGTIDSSDLGLMLVNYGNCYESAIPEPQEQEPFILQSVETPTPLLLNKK